MPTVCLPCSPLYRMSSCAFRHRVLHTVGMETHSTCHTVVTCQLTAFIPWPWQENETGPKKAHGALRPGCALFTEENTVIYHVRTPALGALTSVHSLHALAPASKSCESKGSRVNFCSPVSQPPPLGHPDCVFWEPPFCEGCPS